MWDSATIVTSNVYKEGTLLWKSSSAFYKGPGIEDWTSMKSTARWEIPKGWEAYLSGGEIRMTKDDEGKLS